MENKKDNSNIVKNEILIYQTSKSNTSEHIKHIFEEEELDEESVVRKFRTAASDGKKYNTIHEHVEPVMMMRKCGLKIKGFNHNI